jgi:hypothetical protein
MNRQNDSGNFLMDFIELASSHVCAPFYQEGRGAPCVFDCDGALGLRCLKSTTVSRVDYAGRFHAFHAADSGRQGHTENQID